MRLDCGWESASAELWFTSSSSRKVNSWPSVLRSSGTVHSSPSPPIRVGGEDTEVVLEVNMARTERGNRDKMPLTLDLSLVIAGAALHNESAVLEVYWF
jgi:hypothetical protein